MKKKFENLAVKFHIIYQKIHNKTRVDIRFKINSNVSRVRIYYQDFIEKKTEFNMKLLPRKTKETFIKHQIQNARLYHV